MDGVEAGTATEDADLTLFFTFFAVGVFTGPSCRLSEFSKRSKHSEGEPSQFSRCSLVIESTRIQTGSTEHRVSNGTRRVKAISNFTWREESWSMMTFSASIRKCATYSLCLVHAFLRASYTWQEALRIV